MGDDCWGRAGGAGAGGGVGTGDGVGTDGGAGAGDADAAGGADTAGGGDCVPPPAGDAAGGPPLGLPPLFPTFAPAGVLGVSGFTTTMVLVGRGPNTDKNLSAGATIKILKKMAPRTTSPMKKTVTRARIVVCMESVY